MKIGFLIAAFVMLFLGANAQHEITLGVKGGLNVSTVGGIGVALSDDRVGFQAGAFATFSFKKLAFQPELVFSQQGHRVSDYLYDPNTTFKTNLNYLNVPLMVKVKLGRKLNLQAGPQVGFLLTSSGPVFKTTDGSVTTERNLSRFVKPADLAVGLGIGWDVSSELSINTRYTYGLTDINNYTGQYNSTTVPNHEQSSLGCTKVYNLVVQFTVEYRLFRFKK